MNNGSGKRPISFLWVVLDLLWNNAHLYHPLLLISQNCETTNSSDGYVLVSSTYSTRLYSDTKQRYSMWQWQGQEALKEEGTDRRRNLCCLLGLFVLDKSTDRGRIDRPHRESTQQRPQHLQAKISVTQRSEVCGVCELANLMYAFSACWEGKQLEQYLIHLNCTKREPVPLLGKRTQTKL